MQAAEPSMDIREAQESDLEAMWSIHTAVADSDLPLPFSGDLDQERFCTLWSAPGQIVAVAEEGPHLLGMYRLAMEPDDGDSHIATACYLVRPDVRGRGVGRALVQHSIARAQDADFAEIRLDYVPANDTSALTLFEELGFEIIETLPGAFHHPQLGQLAAYVLQRFLQ